MIVPVCPAPLVTRDTVLLGHGSGGKLSAELLRDVFLPAFANPVLDKLDDAAVLASPEVTAYDADDVIYMRYVVKRRAQ